MPNMAALMIQELAMLLAQSPKKATFLPLSVRYRRVGRVVLQHGEEIGVELAGVVEVGQAVDDRHGRRGGKLFDDARARRSG